MEGTTLQEMFRIEMQITSRVDFGLGVGEATTRKESIPPLGVRADYRMEGTISGTGLSGTISATDYYRLEPDGIGRNHAHGMIMAQDGALISVESDGIATPMADGKLSLRLTTSCYTCAARYAWLNRIPLWLVGELDAATGAGSYRAYAFAQALAASG